MYRSHPAFDEPENEEIKIWRYMDFSKLVSLIDSQQLFFCRADKMIDTFEGSMPRRNFEEREEKMAAFTGNYYQYGSEWYRNLQRYIALSCWHQNEHESAAMWDLYLKSQEGIAIQSTYIKLKESIEDKTTVYMGKVRYIDYSSEDIDSKNDLKLYMHKRKSFEHEREIRALVAESPQYKNVYEDEKLTRVYIEVGENNYDFSIEKISSGVPISVNVEKLIENIFIAPTAPLWFANLVKKVVDKYGFNIPVIQSKLYSDPLY